MKNLTITLLSALLLTATLSCHHDKVQVVPDGKVATHDGASDAKSDASSDASTDKKADGNSDGASDAKSDAGSDAGSDKA